MDQDVSIASIFMWGSATRKFSVHLQSVIVSLSVSGLWNDGCVDNTCLDGKIWQAFWMWLLLSIGRSRRVPEAYRRMHLKCQQAGMVVKGDIVYALMQILDPDGLEVRRRLKMTEVLLTMSQQPVPSRFIWLLIYWQYRNFAEALGFKSSFCSIPIFPSIHTAVPCWKSRTCTAVCRFMWTVLKWTTNVFLCSTVC